MDTGDSLLSALGTILTLQRWNFVPRIETWVEAENAAYVCHVGYALGRTRGLPDNHLLAFFRRCMLQSLSKHFRTDMAVAVSHLVRSVDKKAWDDLIDATASETSALFPK